ncbi:MAG: HD domain-containing protein [Deltaproteobacteria bacterium]|nr:HD domain-containing protein [Deltaproteobacteria bacterium]
MAHIPVNKLKEGDDVQQYFLLRDMSRRTTRSGKPYLDLILADRTGTIKGKVWSEALDKLDDQVGPGVFVGVRGRVETYNQEMTITVTTLVSTADIEARRGVVKDFDPDLLIPRTPGDVAVMWQDLLDVVENELQDQHVRNLVREVLTRYGGEFKTSPAARMYHHGYLGGLLEHTHKITQLALAVKDLYPQLDGDVLLAGAILHDVGKIKEMSGFLNPSTTMAGHFLGHIILGRDMVRDVLTAMGLSDSDSEKIIQIEHIILSHHGQMEFGSPVLPLTREALVVHALDDLDAKMKMINDQIDSDKTEDSFTSWHKVLKRSIFKGTCRPDADDLTND